MLTERAPHGLKSRPGVPMLTRGFGETAPSAVLVLVADSPIEDEFVWTMRNVGIDHVLLGSDYPQYSLEQNVSALGRLDLDESEKAKIRYGNARALFGLR